MSTSGRSPNVIQAVQAAKARNVFTMALLGGDGGNVRELVDLAICVPATDPQRIQEIHILVLHLICEWIEEDLLRSQSATLPENTWDVCAVQSVASSNLTLTHVPTHREPPVVALETQDTGRF
jgi:hypothetical protein